MAIELGRIDWFIFCISILLVVVYAIRSGRRSTLSSYLVHDRKVPSFLLSVTSIASFMGAGLMIGVVNASYDSWLTVGLLGFVFGLGFLLVGLAASRIRLITGENKLNTLPEFLQWRYSDRCRIASSIINLIAYLLLAALQFVGISIFLSSLSGINPRIVIVAIGVLTIIYTSWSGLRGEFFTDYIQGLFMFSFIVLLVPLLITKAGGFSEFVNIINNARKVDTSNLAVLLALGIFVLSPSLLGSMDVWQRIIAAKNAKTARRTMYYTAIVIVIVFVMFMIVGILSNELFPSIETSPAVVVFLSIFPAGGFLGLALSGLIAAMMSTVDTMIFVAGVSLSNDLRNIFKHSTDSKRLLDVRVSTIICGILAILFALLFQDIVNLVSGALSSLAILVPATLAGLFWKKINERAAFWSIIIGAATLYITTGILSAVNSEAVQLAAFPAVLFSFLVLLVMGKSKIKYENNET